MIKYLKILLLMFAILFIHNSVFASDNVLQAIQINGVSDSYNIILKSDDVAEMQKTIQAPNKMIINLKGIRASKTINTIYNNTSSVDSVVVEPIGDDAVKISVQGENVSSAEVNFDSLKTPLGVMGNSSTANKPSGSIVLSDPVNSYRPIYSKDNNDDEESFSLADTSSALGSILKSILKNDKLSWMITIGLFAILLLTGMKLIRGKDNDIRVGLSQSLKEREIDLYRGGLNLVDDAPVNNQIPQTGMNYGLRTYQQGLRNPYVSSEIQRKPVQSVPIRKPNITSDPGRSAERKNTLGVSTQAAVQTPIRAAAKTKTTNIDSMKFLESMTKIYEKNGRTDLAQGLKANMQKAKTKI